MVAVNKHQRGSFGEVVTEAAIVPQSNVNFKARVNAYLWTNVDDDPPIEIEPISVKWSDAGRKLNQAALREIVGLTGTPPMPDNALRDALLQELKNREIIWSLWQGTINQAKSGGAPTSFLTTPLATAIANGCLHPTGGTFTKEDLMIIFHMFGKGSSGNPRPLATITAGDFYYSTETEIAGELARRVNELVYGVTWEGPVKGEHDPKNMVWHRIGFYCGCG